MKKKKETTQAEKLDLIVRILTFLLIAVIISLFVFSSSENHIMNIPKWQTLYEEKERTNENSIHGK